MTDEGYDAKVARLRERIAKLKKNPANARAIADLEDELKLLEHEAKKTDGQKLMDAVSTLRGRVEVAATNKLDANSPEYEKAYKASNEALREYEVAVQAFRARKISDDEFAKARKKRDAAMAIFDKAFNKEASRKDADKKPEEGGKYNAAAVQKEINKDKRIGGKEAKLIHSLLKGRTNKPSGKP